MNQTKLVGLIKSLVTEVHHAARYSGNLSGRPNKLGKRGIPNKTPQLAEIKKEKKKEITGKTDTGQSANKIITEPAYNSQMTAASGPKPQIDTK